MIVELCQVDDKRASTIVHNNRKIGHKILRGRLYPNNPAEHYYIEVLTDNKAYVTELKSIPDGTYILLTDKGTKHEVS